MGSILFLFLFLLSLIFSSLFLCLFAFFFFSLFHFNVFLYFSSIFISFLFCFYPYRIHLYFFFSLYFLARFLIIFNFPLFLSSVSSSPFDIFFICSFLYFSHPIFSSPPQFTPIHHPHPGTPYISLSSFFFSFHSAVLFHLFSFHSPPPQPFCCSLEHSYLLYSIFFFSHQSIANVFNLPPPPPFL
ncbi:unnamed protein product [Acanthosepion pharaonis]|uniref:Uncharacterized protein n=1 Tax=Acanthosepion pharaonis TaxID=158019 RepID=A0A812DPQ3_ACAPH|nr:unnamed protein product [Sepia pharaonis]